jgi:hypothetical protein|tara:strand:+ start:111 stop:398 length:288 start_codon:yes stop_codon:yes gene_type:complete
VPPKTTKKGSKGKPTKAKSISFYSKKYNIPTSTLNKVYSRGMGAYYGGGSRAGTTPQQWAMGRVRSFATGKGGARKADADLLKKGKKKSGIKKKA